MFPTHADTGRSAATRVCARVLRRAILRPHARARRRAYIAPRGPVAKRFGEEERTIFHDEMSAPYRGAAVCCHHGTRQPDGAISSLVAYVIKCVFTHYTILFVRSK